jgi:hypothetical protein
MVGKFGTTFFQLGSPNSRASNIHIGYSAPPRQMRHGPRWSKGSRAGKDQILPADCAQFVSKFAFVSKDTPR